METSFASSPMVWNSQLGEFISDDHQHLAEILNDYNPNLSLVFIPMKDRQPGDTKPFAILESRPGFAPQIVRYLSEADMLHPTTVLEWVFVGDTTKNGGAAGLIRRMEAHDAADKLMKLKQREAELEDISEHVAFMSTGGRNKLHTIHHNGKKLER